MKQAPPSPEQPGKVGPTEEPNEYASPPCLRHELDPAYAGDLDDGESVPLIKRPVDLS